jgi:dihydroorotate dehydrogenase (NAD+) catalytic subunit
MMAGASAIQVGTASFADPRSVARVQDEMQDWCSGHGVRSVREVIGVVHAR